MFAYAVNDAEFARRAVEAGVCGVFTQSADEAVLQPLAQAGVECLPVPSVVKFAKLADYFSCGRVAACLCPDLETQELLGKSYFDAVVRRTRQAVSAMLGFDLRHVGINQPDAESSARTAGEFESLFGFTRTDRGGAYFAGEVVEVTENTAKVLLVRDEDFSAAAFLSPGREEGLLAGGGTGAVLLKYVPLLSQVKPGDKVYTSAASSIFPAGILAGEVSAVRRGGSFQTALTVEVAPAISSSTLKEVFVILNKDKKKK